MKLLLAIDGSSFSDPVVHTAVSRPWPPQSVARILTVVETLYPVVPEAALTTNLADAQEMLRKQAEALVQSLSELIAKSGLATETCIREGDAAHEIVDEARDWNADLIVTGSHGRRGLKRVFLGSVAHYVVSHAPCSVEVVRA
jgi:nucleotide-binding universal stress UspA family protein